MLVKMQKPKWVISGKKYTWKHNEKEIIMHKLLIKLD